MAIEEIDKLSEQHVATRKAFLSEMLCLRFPVPRGATEGVALLTWPENFGSLFYRTRTLLPKTFELDTVIWLEMAK